MKNRIPFFLFVCLAIVLSSCASRRAAVVTKETQKTVVTETLRDTVFSIPADSSSIQARIDVIDGQPVIKEIISQKPGRKLKSPGIRIEGNTLSCDCEKETEELRAQLKDRTKSDSTVTEVPVITNVLSWWQQTQIYMFWGMLILWLIAIICLIIKSRFKQ